MSDRLMHTLAAVCRGSGFEVWDDSRMAVVLPHGRWEVFGEEIDTLLDRGWVELTAEGETDFIRHTWAGLKALRAWEQELGRVARCSS